MVKITELAYMNWDIQTLQHQGPKKIPRLHPRKTLSLSSFVLGKSQNEDVIAFPK